MLVLNEALGVCDVGLLLKELAIPGDTDTATWSRCLDVECAVKERSAMLKAGKPSQKR